MIRKSPIRIIIIYFQSIGTPVNGTTISINPVRPMI
jgi:hypothetical protein